MDGFFSFQIPSNVWTWLIGALVFIPLGFRSWRRAKKLQSPTYRYFAVTGLGVGFGLLIYSLPAIITTNPKALQLGLTLGVFPLYAALAYQPYYTWYVLFQDKFSHWWFSAPAIAIASTQAVIDIYSGIKDGVYNVNNELVFSFYFPARVLQSILLLFAIINGVIFIFQSRGLSDKKAKLRLASIGMLYILTAVGVIYDNLIAQGQNDNPVVLLGFLIGGSLFLITFILVLIRSPLKNPIQPANNSEYAKKPLVR